MVNILFFPFALSQTTDEIMTQHGVIDRINKNDIAVILLEDIGEECLVHVKDLPEGSAEQTWVTVKFIKAKNMCDVIEINEKKTIDEKERSNHLQKQLKKRE